MIVCWSYVRVLSYHPFLFSLCSATENPKSDPSGPEKTEVGSAWMLNALLGFRPAQHSNNKINKIAGTIATEGVTAL